MTLLKITVNGDFCFEMKPPKRSQFDKTNSGANAEPVGRRSIGRPKVVPDEVARQKIIEATCALFVEQGYQSVTMAKVAAAAHVSLSTIYRLFPGKPQLFSALVDQHRHSMIALPGDFDGLSIEAALEKIFWVDIDAETERRRSELVRMFVAEEHRFPELRPVFHGQGPEYARELLIEWLEDQQAQGRIQIADAKITACMLMDVAFGLSSPKSSGDSQWGANSDRTHYLKTCFAVIMDGLRPRNQSEETEKGNEA
ncbi:TetR/AcrR family transcriptional regulator [Consotaella aegiceratis]|uniref:TetR/AcrR family transcriptional regulator n=1 Tax=Consotaella aegiceratis TaxID=3097961 RepID=UPI002F409B0F